MSGLSPNIPKASRVNPLILRTSVTVPANATVQAATAPLQNPFREGMFIDEVRISVPTANFSDIFLKLDLGRVPLTNGFISPMCFAKAINIDILSSPNYIFTWRFPRPLFVPGNELLVPTFRNNPLNPPGATIESSITYVCRSYTGNKQPDVLNVPWCAAYQTPAKSDAIVFAYTEESTESDLTNPFNEPLHLQRFVSARPAYSIDSLAHFLTNVLVRMSDSQGRHVVATPTPIGNLCFLPEGGVWNVNAVMPPKSFFKSWWDINQTVAGQASKQFLGIVGHREVRIR